jgi:gluconate 2-dehydrogenase gamma chain
MPEAGLSRRALFQRSAGAVSAWLAANWPAILAAQEHAHHAAASGAPTHFEFFTAEQAAEIEAIAAQIIPTDDTPGAHEAGVIHFIDRALTTFDKDKQPLYREGLEQLHAKLKARFPHAGRMSGLSPAQQIELLRSIEQSAFFELVRTHTIVGFFAKPEYGGNKDKVGWKLIGFEDNYVFKPPFGYYDKDYRG